MSFPIPRLLLGTSLILAACGEKAPPSPPPADTPTVTVDVGGQTQDPATLTYAPVTGVDISRMTLDSAGFYWQDVVVGDGAVAEKGKTLSVNYTGWLPDGTEFDSSLKPGRQPFSYVLSMGQVIPGWNIAPEGMRVGGVRLIVLPSELAYGVMGSPPVIPGGAVLVFRLELLGVQ